METRETAAQAYMAGMEKGARILAVLAIGALALHLPAKVFGVY